MRKTLTLIRTNRERHHKEVNSAVFDHVLMECEECKSF